MPDSSFQEISKTLRLGTGKVFSIGTFSVLFLFGTLFYFYVSQNYTYLVERNFRVLSTWSKELRETFENYQRSFQFRLQEIQSGKIPSTRVRSRSTTKHMASEGQVLLGYADSFVLEIPPKQLTIQKELEKLPFVDHVQVIQPQASSSLQSSISPQTIHFSLQQGQKAGELSFSATGKEATIRATIALNHLIKNVAQGSVFEDVLLADPTGNIVYQNNRSTLQFSHLRNLFYNQRIDTGWLADFFREGGVNAHKPFDLKNFHDVLYASTPAHFQVMIGGTSFDVFMQAVSIPQINGSGNPPKDLPNSWIICGLLPTPDFQEQYLSIPFTVLLICIFLLISVILGLPLFSLVLMHPRERLSRFSVGMLVITNILAAGVGTFFLLDLVFYKQMTQTLNERMQQSGESLHEAFQLQLDRSLSQLIRFDRKIDALGDLEQFPQSPDSKAWLARINIPDPCLDKDGQIIATCFPDFSVAFWVDPKGFLRETWTRGHSPYVRGVHDLRQRAYVSSFHQQTSPFNRRLIDEQWVEFYAQPLISLESSQRSLVISTPHQTLKTESTESNPWIAAIQTEELSLLKPAILPPGAGYAVIEDQTGLVLFHSDEHRMLRENFLEETDNHGELTSLIYSRTSGLIDGNYWGMGHYFFVKPISDLPWTLVMFRNKEPLRAINFEILIFSTCLFSLYILSLLLWGRLLAALYQFDAQGRLIRWLWPRQAAHSAYNWLSLFQVVLGLIFLFAIIALDWNWGISQQFTIAFLAVPFIGLWVAMRTLWKKACPLPENIQESPDPSWILGDSRSLYRAFSRFAVASFFLLGVFPAIIMFKLGHDEEMRMFVQQQLWGMSEILQHHTTAPWEALGTGTTPKDFHYMSSQRPCLFPGCTTNSSSLPLPGSPSCGVSRTASFSESYFPYSLQNLYPDFAFPICLSFNSGITQDPAPSSPRWLRAFHRVIRKSSLHSSTVQQSWGFLDLSPSTSQNHWFKTISKDKQTLYLPIKPFVASLDDKGETFGTLWLRGALQLFPWSLGPLAGALILLGVMFLLFGYLLLHFMVAKVFPLPSFHFRSHEWLQHDQGRSEESLRHLLLFGAPGTGKTEAIHLLPQSFEIFDFHSIKGKEHWAESGLKTIQGNKGGVVLDHFEFQLGLPQTDEEKRYFIGELLSRGHKLCIVTSHDPFSGHVETGKHPPGHSQEVSKDPWVHLFQSFGMMYFLPRKSMDILRIWLEPTAVHEISKDQGQPLKVKSLLKSEAQPTSQLRKIGNWIFALHEWPMLAPQELQQQFQFVASPYYRSLWHSCSVQEQLALFHIAQDGYLHANNPELASLTQNGLVRVTPDLQIMNGSFRRFILQIGNESNILKWKDRANEETWANLRLPFLLIFAIILIFLFVTQQEFKNSFITLISLLPIILPALPELPLLFNSPKNALPSSG